MRITSIMASHPDNNAKIFKKIRACCDALKSHVEITDIAFIILRIIAFVGGISWLIFADLPNEMVRKINSLFFYFVVYSIFIHFLLFLSPVKKKTIYVLSLFFDHSFVSLLVEATGGFGSPFFNGYCLLTALYSFYYGAIAGIGVATMATLLYFISVGADFNTIRWTDFSVRVAILFLLAVPIGMFSEKLRSEKEKVENLNKELKESMEAMRSLQGKLVQAEKLSTIGRLTAEVAHEIRNPLTALGGFIKRLENKLSEGTKEKMYAELIMSEVNRLERLLRDTLTFSREARFHVEPRTINEAVEESIQSYIDVFNRQSIEVKKNLDKSLPPILIDKDKVRQAVNNLISNAIDAMPDGGMVKVSTFMEPMNDVNYVVVKIADTGCGIPEDKLDKIFEAFYTTKKVEGTGLGLSICKKMMDEHNGLIRAESELGSGSSFKLFFPYQSEGESAKIKCWEFTRCGVEKMEGAAEMRCAAYPDYGRICWAVAGTFCGKRVSGAIAQKLGECKKCEFYQRVVVGKDL